jgi:hypothetical protein
VSLDPNYTDYPNALFDHWMRILEPSEFSVLMAIARFTFGFPSNPPGIATEIDVLAKRSGLDEQTVAAALASLTARGILPGMNL